MTLTSRSLIGVLMVKHKISDQYLTSGKVSTRSINGFKRYRLLKTLTKNFNVLCNANADTDALVTAIALLVLSYRQTKNEKKDNKQCLLDTPHTHTNPLPRTVMVHKENYYQEHKGYTSWLTLKSSYLTKKMFLA